MPYENVMLYQARATFHYDIITDHIYCQIKIPPTLILHVWRLNHQIFGPPKFPAIRYDTIKSVDHSLGRNHLDTARPEGDKAALLCHR